MPRTPCTNPDCPNRNTTASAITAIAALLILCTTVVTVIWLIAGPR